MNSKVLGSLLIKQVVNDSYVVIDQNPLGSIEKSDEKIIQSNELGLSKSRNLALKNANSDVVYFLDDDVELVKDFNQIIRDEFDKHPNADFVIFEHYNDSKIKKSWLRRIPFIPMKIKLMSVCSIEISGRMVFINQNKLTFNERFGLGSGVPIGEEFLFLSNAYEMGAKIVFASAAIVKHFGSSSGYKYKTPQDVINRGTVIAQGFTLGRSLVCLIFALKSYRFYKRSFNFYSFFSLLLKGLDNRE